MFVYASIRFHDQGALFTTRGVESPIFLKLQVCPGLVPVIDIWILSVRLAAEVVAGLLTS